MSWTRVCKLSDIAEESALQVEVEGDPVCIARSGGEVFAVDDICSHAEVSLSEGDVEDGRVECWLHGSRFDLRTGKATSLPATEPIAVFPVKVEGDEVLVDVEP